MPLPDLIRQYFERATAIQNYWTVYILVIGGILAFSTFRPNRNLAKTLVLSLLYLCFAYRNCGAIVETIHQRDNFREAILKGQISGAADGQNITHVVNTLTGTSPQGAINFHILCDALTLAAIWSMELRRRKPSDTLP